jgi:hypothetical protein
VFDGSHNNEIFETARATAITLSHLAGKGRLKRIVLRR